VLSAGQVAEVACDCSGEQSGVCTGDQSCGSSLEVGLLICSTDGALVSGESGLIKQEVSPLVPHKSTREFIHVFPCGSFLGRY